MNQYSGSGKLYADNGPLIYEGDSWTVNTKATALCMMGMGTFFIRRVYPGMYEGQGVLYFQTAR